MVVRTVCALVLALGSLLFLGRSAEANWTSNGVQTRCDAAQGTFEILAYVRPRESDDMLQKGFKGVQEGPSLRGCRLGTRSVLAQITVQPSAKTDKCKSGGTIGIPSLAVDGVELEEELSTLSWWCAQPDRPAFIRITIKTAPGGVAYTLCATNSARDGTWDDKPRCDMRSVDIDKQAAAFAKVDRDLADAKTQAAQSATKLPSTLDMAKVFANQKDPDGAPICTHWTGEFAWSNEVQAWARIGGKAGEHTPIHAVHPALCTDKADQTCDSTAYVIAGDRVDLGPICGAWTAIRYHPRVRAFPDTKGWVETVRLYGVQSLPEPKQPADSTEGEDPLTAAVQSGDLQAVTDLLGGGANPNGIDGSGRPLLLAIMGNQLRTMNALLAAGAKPDPGIVGWNGVGMSALEMAAKVDRAQAYQTQALTIDPIIQMQILLQHGAKVDAVDARALTPLRRAIGANNVDVVAFLLGAGADPNKTVNVGETDTPGYTPLMEAVLDYEWSRDPSVIRLLLDHGAKPELMTHNEAFKPQYRGKYGETALTVAASKGFITVVRDLLEHGADPAQPREDGMLPADLAGKAGFSKIAELLTQATAGKAPPAPAQ